MNSVEVLGEESDAKLLVTGGLVGGQLELITLCLCTETRENFRGCICILTCITKP